MGQHPCVALRGAPKTRSVATKRRRSGVSRPQRRFATELAKASVCKFDAAREPDTGDRSREFHAAVATARLRALFIPQDDSDRLGVDSVGRRINSGAAYVLEFAVLQAEIEPRGRGSAVRGVFSGSCSGRHGLIRQSQSLRLRRSGNAKTGGAEAQYSYSQ